MPSLKALQYDHYNGRDAGSLIRVRVDYRAGADSVERTTSQPRPLSTSFRTLKDEMAKEEAIELEGTVSEVLPSATFRVHLTNGHDVLATMAGKMRRFRIRVLQGDRVSVEVSPYDLSRGRITFRHKN